MKESEDIVIDSTKRQVSFAVANDRDHDGRKHSYEVVDVERGDGVNIGANGEEQLPLLPNSSDLIIKHKYINFFWTEKLLLWVDFLQIYGVLWIMSQPYPWPYIWSKWTHNVVWLNLDYFSTTVNGSVLGSTMNNISKWGEMNNYVWYALPFGLFPLVIVLIFACFEFNAKKFNYLKQYRFTVHSSCLFILMESYLPILIAFSRLLYCEGGYLAADPSETCWSLPHLVITLVSALFVFPFAFLLPFIIYYFIQDVLMYHLVSDNEKRLQAWEISQILEIDQFWQSSQLWLTSSFNRRGSYFRVGMLVFKLTITVVMIGFRFNMIAQATLFWLLSVFGCIYCFAYRPYRLVTTNVFLCTFSLLLLTDASFAVGNACGIRNVIMVSSNESLWLLAANCLALAVMVGVSVFVLVSRQDEWPPFQTLQRISESSMKNEVIHWIECLKIAYMIDMDCRISNFIVVDIPLLEEQIRTLRKCWISASSVGSVFNIILSDALERLLITHSHLAPTACRTKVCWDDAWVEASVTKLFKKRHEKYKLMTPRKRKILNKLLALKAFQDLRHETVKKHAELQRILANRDKFKFSSFASFNLSFQEETEKDRVVLEKNWADPRKYEEKLVYVRDLASKTERLVKDKRAGKGLNVKELGSLYESWNNLVYELESKELAGGARFTRDQTEEWYTYRHILADMFGAVDVSDDEEDIRSVNSQFSFA